MVRCFLVACLALLWCADVRGAGNPAFPPPGVVYDIDPTLPAYHDLIGARAAVRPTNSGSTLGRGSGQSQLLRWGLNGSPIIENNTGGSPDGWDSVVFNPSFANAFTAQFAAGTLRPTNVAASVQDTSANYDMTPNNPLRTPLPVVSGAVPGDGLTMAPGTRNAFSLVMGSAQKGANMTTSQSIRDHFFLNYMEGDLNSAVGSPMDTGQANNATFAAVARHYRVGAPNDLHVMQADGMHLRAICSQDHTDCSPGHVWGAMVRLPFEWRPGMTLKVRYRSPKGDHSWAPIWMFTGQQISPGPGGNPYAGFGGPNTLYRASKVNFEIDWNDNYSRFRNGVATGYQIDFGTPDIYGTNWKVKPHGIYWANGNGWRYFDHSYAPEFERTPFDWSAGFHDLVGNWRGDGSNLIDLFVDGKLVSTVYMEYPQQTYVDPADGQEKTVAMHLIIGNQAIPSFSRSSKPVVDNDGIPDGWTIVVQEISGWYGNVDHPDRYRVSPDSGVK
jgi:hypothetical protein